MVRAMLHCYCTCPQSATKLPHLTPVAVLMGILESPFEPFRARPSFRLWIRHAQLLHFMVLFNFVLFCFVSISSTVVVIFSPLFPSSLLFVLTILIIALTSPPPLSPLHNARCKDVTPPSTRIESFSTMVIRCFVCSTMYSSRNTI